MILYTDKGMKNFPDGARQAARAIGPLIIIRPEYRDDLGLHEHERVHVQQWGFVTLT